MLAVVGNARRVRPEGLVAPFNDLARLVHAAADDGRREGVEVPHEPRRLRALCDWVKASDLHLSAHAGEFFDAAPVSQALDLGVERIGHGIQIADDETVLERVVAHDVTLEVCPISNYRTGALTPDAAHPLRRLLKAGVRVTINSDDQGVQNSSWRDDYDFAAQEIGLSEDEVRKCLRTAFEASFLSAEAKKEYGALFADPDAAS